MTSSSSTQTSFVVCLLLATLLWPKPGLAWWVDGHALQAKAAVISLPEAVPDFFRAAGSTIGYFAADPDFAKSPQLPHLRKAEGPEHYFDLELLGGRQVPDTRGELVALCAELELKPDKVGFVIYAIAELTERLSLAFAEHRKWPHVEALRFKCLVYAGLIAHYAQDLCQPLHTTVHFDGRIDAKGRSPHSGIHESIDSVIGRLELKPQELMVEGVEAYPLLMPAILHELEASHRLVGRVYELESGFRSPVTDEVRAFAVERSTAATRFVASLFLTAWLMSEGVEIPNWLTPE